MRLKKLTVAAIAVACAAPVLAQTETQIYGKLYPYVLSEKGSGATPVGTPVATFAATPTGTSGVGKTQGMVAGNSRLGFRGTEDLGGGMKVLWQVEGTVAVDNPAAQTFNRDTFVGLQGGFGTVRLGNMDTIFKEYGDTLGILGVSSGTFMSTSDVLRKSGMGTSSASSFHLRRANSVKYETPEFGNVQFGAQYSTDEVTEGPRKPRLASFGARYDAGPVYLSIAHEIHWDFYGGSRNVRTAQRNNGTGDPTHSKDSATQIALEYRLNKQHKLEFDVIRKDYKENATVTGRFGSYSNTAYLFAWENRWTDQFRTAGHIVRAAKGDCTRVGSTCSTDGLDATKFTLAAGYNLSKRTMLFAAYSLLKNGKSARYNNAELGGDPNPGENIRHIAMGISHSF